MQGHAAANVSIIGGNGREEQGVRSRAWYLINWNFSLSCWIYTDDPRCR
jgi:hypothetical protein